MRVKKLLLFLCPIDPCLFTCLCSFVVVILCLKFMVLIECLSSHCYEFSLLFDVWRFCKMWLNSDQRVGTENVWMQIAWIHLIKEITKKFCHANDFMF